LPAATARVPAFPPFAAAVATAVEAAVVVVVDAAGVAPVALILLLLSALMPEEERLPMSTICNWLRDMICVWQYVYDWDQQACRLVDT
jgi:hypothetical protein